MTVEPSPRSPARSPVLQSGITTRLCLRAGRLQVLNLATYYPINRRLVRHLHVIVPEAADTQSPQRCRSG